MRTLKFKTLLIQLSIIGYAAFIGGWTQKTFADSAFNSIGQEGRMGAGRCEAASPDHVCLALKYSVYRDHLGEPVVSQAEAFQNVREVDQVWSQCKIGFEIESFVQVDPSEDQLNYRPADTGELDIIRRRLEDPEHLLVVTTGTWNRAGTLGRSPANAWTSMPGENLYGAILEKPVGRFGNIIAHELGHYLNLDHVNDAQSLMNPVIYDNSTSLSREQCENARYAVRTYWQKMIRN